MNDLLENWQQRSYRVVVRWIKGTVIFVACTREENIYATLIKHEGGTNSLKTLETREAKHCWKLE
jgi:hypothetical protein